MIRSFNGNTPDIDPAAYVSSSAVVIGSVKLRDGSSVWPGAVLRGDVCGINVGRRSNIQDACVLHTNYDKPVIIGDDVTVGHGAILHGCVIDSGCLIGMGSIILDGAKVERGCIIAAGALVPEGGTCQAGGLYMGIPAVRKRDITPSEISLIKERTLEYAEYSRQYAEKGL